MSLVALTVFTIILFLGIFVLTALIGAVRRMHHRDAEKQLQQLGHRFFYRRLHQIVFPKQNFEGILLVIRCTLSLAQFSLALCIFLWLWYFGFLPPSADQYSALRILLVLLIAIIPLFFLGDFLPRFLGMRYPRQTLKVTAPASVPLLLLSFPVCFLFLKILEVVLKPSYFEHLSGDAAQLPAELLQLLQEAAINPELAAHDRKLFESVANFRKRIAREVMVPRIDVFSLPADTSIREAAIELAKEGYSRTPVYVNSVDEIVGVLMYKDIQKKYMQAFESKDLSILDAPINTLVKSVLYTPETKPISNLLQEFRHKQVHLAIVVDEYGGTEGIVTIEDILEALVGEISDEYDDREALAIPHPKGGWIIDPRMSILDAEERLKIKIPQEGEYDTVAGYIFHCAGAIPTKGFVIHRDTFEIEILSSNDRAVLEVRIKPLAAVD